MPKRNGSVGPQKTNKTKNSARIFSIGEKLDSYLFVYFQRLKNSFRA